MTTSAPHKLRKGLMLKFIPQITHNNTGTEQVDSMPFRRFVPVLPPPSPRTNRDRMDVTESHAARNCCRSTKDHARSLRKTPHNVRPRKRQDLHQQQEQSMRPTNVCTDATSGGAHSMRRTEVLQLHGHSDPQTGSLDPDSDEDSPLCEDLIPDMILISKLADATTDPFDQIKIPMNSERYALLQYFINTFLPVNLGPGNPYMFPCDPQKHCDLIRDCLSAPVHTYALLTAASARIKYFGGQTLPEAYAYLTIRHLRRQLASLDKATQPLLFSIVLLRTQAVYDGRWAVVDHHDKLLDYLIETTFGGFSRLDPLLRQMLWYADRSQAAATGRKPMFKYSPRLKPAAKQLCSAIHQSLFRLEIPLMGQAFRELYGSFDIHFQQILDKTVQLAHFLQHYWSREAPQLDRDLLIARGFELLERLHHADTFEDNPAHPGAGVKLQRCLRIALIIWLTLTFHPMSFIPANVSLQNQTIRIDFDARPLQQRFTEAFECYEDQPLPAETHHLLLWVAALGVLAFKATTAREWFVRHLRILWIELESPGQRKLADISDGYLWLDHIERCRGIDISELLANPADGLETW